MHYLVLKASHGPHSFNTLHDRFMMQCRSNVLKERWKNFLKVEQTEQKLTVWLEVKTHTTHYQLFPLLCHVRRSISYLFFFSSLDLFTNWSLIRKQETERSLLTWKWPYINCFIISTWHSDGSHTYRPWFNPTSNALAQCKEHTLWSVSNPSSNQ